MRDLFREGLKLGESLARLPWEAARRVAGGRSETFEKAADLGERLGTLPFRAANKMIGEEGGEPPKVAQTGAPDVEKGAVRAGGQGPRARIVVLGAGYAGLTAFLELQDHLGRDYDVVLVNGDKYHWFTTELHTYVAGESEDAVRIPLKRVVSRPGRLVLGRVVKVHANQQEVEMEGGERLSYDYLVFALGSDPEYYGLPGVAEHSLIVGTWQGATALRERITKLISDRITRQGLPHIVVAGGGLTGVEVAGELADEYPGRVQLTIVEAGPEIMSGFAPELVQTARQVLEGKGIEIKTGNPIVRVEANLIHFKNGETLPFTQLVWAGGVRGNAILGQAGFATTPKGRGKVDAYLRAEGHDEVYIIGDSAAFVDPATGRELPPTAQAAVQMGRAAGRNLLRRLRGQAELPFVPRIKGAFASLGHVEGVGQIGEEQYKGLPAMVIKGVIEAQHAWESGGGVMPLIQRLLRAPRHAVGGRPKRAGGKVAAPAARPEARRG